MFASCHRRSSWGVYPLTSIKWLAVLLVVVSASVANAGWSPEFGGIGFDSEVTDSAVIQEELVTAGRFHGVWGEPILGIARWDGERWRGYGPGIRSNFALHVTEFRGDLYAAGAFKTVDEDSIRGIARWDGTSWQPLAKGLDGKVHSLLTYGDFLIAAGDFTVVGAEDIRDLARWDGAAWFPLGRGVGGSGNVRVLALTAHAGSLVAGGFFTRAGDLEVMNVARWDGTAWSAVGNGFDDVVHALHVHDGKLVAGGVFRHAGGEEARSVAAWDGISWRPLGAGMLHVERVEKRPVVGAFVAWQGDLVAAGEFLTADGVVANSVAVWDGDSWNRLGAGFENPTGSNPHPDTVHTLVVHDGVLHAFGNFRYSGDAKVNHAARWDGRAWRSLRGGMGQDLRAYYPTLHFDGALVTGGESLKHAGGIPVAGIARWVDGTWQAFPGWWRHGQAMVGGPYDLATYEGRLIAAGMFNNAADKGIVTFAQWDGEWSAMDPSQPWAMSQISDMVVHGDRLYAAGRFARRGGPWVALIAWDGNSWEVVDTGLEPGTIQAMAVHDGRLLVAHGTHFSPVPPYRHEIRSWEGAVWQIIKEQDDGEVSSFLAHEGRLYAGFARLNAVAGETHSVMTLVDGSWNALGPDFSRRGARTWASVDALAMYRGRLVAGGSFDTLGEMRRDFIVYWDGENWQPMAGGTDGQVLALVPEPDRLWILGRFHKAGGLPSEGVARWDGDLPAPPPTVPEEPKTSEPRVLGRFVLPGQIREEFDNGAFTAWEDGNPVGWEFVDVTHGSPVASRLVPLDGGGVAVSPAPAHNGAYYIEIQQRVRVEPGAYYRLGIEARVAPPGTWADRGNSVARLQFQPYHEQTRMLGDFLTTGLRFEVPEPGWREVDLLCPPNMNVATITIQGAAVGGRIEIPRVHFGQIDLTAVAVFDSLVMAMEAEYPHYDRCPAPWDSLVAASRARMEAVTEQAGFMRVLTDMFTTVGDPSITMVTTGRMCVSNGWRLPDAGPGHGNWRFGAPAEIMQRLMDISSSHGWLPGDVCYMFLPIGRVPHGGRLDDFAEAKGIILDLRRSRELSTTGSVAARARIREFADFIAPGESFYGFQQRRAGAERPQFDEPQPLFVEPSPDGRPGLPVVAIIGPGTGGSMVELAMMLKALPNAVLVGQPTAGMNHMGEPIHLPLALNVSFPRSRILHTDGSVVWAGNGVEPDIVVEPDESAVAEFEMAETLIRKMIAEDDIPQPEGGGGGG